MDLLAGTKRLPSKKVASKKVTFSAPESISEKSLTARKTQKLQRPPVQGINNPIFANAGKMDIQKEYLALPEEELRGIEVTRQEKAIIATRSLQQRRELPELEVTDIIIGLFDPKLLEKEAVFEARKSEDVGPFSVNDPRTGTVEDKVACVTCGLDNLDCPGHLGIIKLNVKIIHPMFRREVVDVLTSVCGSCGGLLLPRDTIEEKGFMSLTGSDRLRAIAEASIGLPCIPNRRREHNSEDENEEEEEEDNEGEIKPCIPNPTYITTKLKETGKVFYTRDKKKKTSNVNIRSVEEIIEILEAISEEDAALLGFTAGSHPKFFILHSLPVIPLCARAPVIQDGMMVKDDLTSMYLDIIRYNNELAKDPRDLAEDERVKKYDSLVFSIEHMMNNSDAKYGQGTKKTYSAIQDRVQGKTGLIRENIMGKRVNYSARTVIGPDPTLRFGQMRVPRITAMYLTPHEIVDASNLRKMMTLLRGGKISYIILSTGKQAGKRIRVNDHIRKTHFLVAGDEVDRHLEDGDWLIFNRQPTLHKQGFMGFEVKLGPPGVYNVGMHLGVTRQFNGD